MSWHRSSRFARQGLSNSQQKKHSTLRYKCFNKKHSAAGSATSGKETLHRPTAVLLWEKLCFSTHKQCHRHRSSDQQTTFERLELNSPADFLTFRITNRISFFDSELILLSAIEEVLSVVFSCLCFSTNHHQTL